MWQEHVQAEQIHDAHPRHRKRVLIIGAGGAGEKILREISDNNHLHYDVVGFIDDDPQKAGRSIHGIFVLGSSTICYDLLNVKTLKRCSFPYLQPVANKCGILLMSAKAVMSFTYVFA